MTHKLKSVFIALVAILLFAGCQTAQRAPQIVLDNVDWQQVAFDASYSAATEYLEREVYSVDRIKRVEGQLALILASDHINYELIVRSLNHLPIRELESDSAKFLLSQGRLLVAMAGNPEIDAEDLPLREVVKGIRDGLNAAVSEWYVR